MCVLSILTFRVTVSGIFLQQTERKIETKMCPLTSKQAADKI
jgi:hypothetical protein